MLKYFKSFTKYKNFVLKVGISELKVTLALAETNRYAYIQSMSPIHRKCAKLTKT